MERLCTFFLVMLLGVSVASCGGSGADSESKSSGEVAATVNGEPVTLEEVMKVANNFAKQGMQPDPETRGSTYEEQLYYTVVDRLVEQKLVAQEADERGLEVTPERVQASISQLKNMAGGDEAYAKLLADNGITPEDIERDTRMNLLMKEFYDQVISAPPQVTPEEIQDYFAKNPQLFGPQQEVHARHILFRTQPDMNDMAVAEVAQKAHAALERAKTEDFAALARDVSEDQTTANNGGDLGWFGKGRMVAPFDSAAFAVPPGEVSGLVKTQYGFHIIQVVETRMSEPKELEEVRGQVQQMAAQEKAQETFKEELDRLREGADVEVKEPSNKTLAALSS